MLKYVILLCLILLHPAQIYIPIQSPNRQCVSNIRLTEIGKFGQLRKARTHVPAHYHTGIDIKRPGRNYQSEPIYPIAEGIIISKRTDGPFANLIIEHKVKGRKVWSLYEHIAGIKVNAGNTVTPATPIARFMNKEELNRYGWQFDHFHLEILKARPQPLKPTHKHPERYCNSYTLACYTEKELNTYFYDPIRFLEQKSAK